MHIGILKHSYFGGPVCLEGDSYCWIWCHNYVLMDAIYIFYVLPRFCCSLKHYLRLSHIQFYGGSPIKCLFFIFITWVYIPFSNRLNLFLIIFLLHLFLWWMPSLSISSSAIYVLHFFILITLKVLSWVF